MEYRPLGRTGLNVSEICLGTMTWGEQNTESEGHEQMDYALERGINFVDTAELYAVPIRAATYGRTEEIVGTWFEKTGRRDDVILATKVAGPGPAWIRDGKARIDRKNILEAVEGSLKRLRTDYIDLYQLHWPNRSTYHFGKHYIGFNGNDPQAEKENLLDVLRTLDDLIKQGKIRHVGLSDDTAWGTMQYLKLAEEHDLPRMASIQNEYSLLCRVFENDLHEISLMEDAGLLAWSSLACGALSGKYLDGKTPKGTRKSVQGHMNHRETKAAEDATRAYIALAEKHGLDVCQMALAFVRQQPFTTTVIIGATTMEQLKSNIDSADLTLSDDLISEINDIHKQYPRPF
jgi:aryl-alcohol dehydrogenase-like predicted oxidoreductase